MPANTDKKKTKPRQSRIRVSQCKDKCQRPDFPIPILQNKQVFPSKGAGKRRTYTYKHREQGLAKCKQCEYITANPMPLGTRCPCCGRILSRAIYHKEAKIFRDNNIKRYD